MVTNPNRFKYFDFKIFNHFSMLLIFIVLFTFAAMPMSFAEETIFVVRADENYPPYEYLENGVPVGFNIDMIKAVSEVMNLKIEIRMGPWEEVRTDLEQGRIDVLAGMYETPERDKLVDFSIPHVVVSQSIFVRNNASVTSLEDLKGKEVIVQKGDVMHDFIVENKITDKVITVENQEQAIQLLASGKHDAALLSKLQAYYFMQKDKLTNVKAVGTPMKLQNYCFAVKENDVALQTQLNEGLKIIKTNGTYKAIYTKWFGIYEEQSLATQVVDVLKWILTPIAIALLIIGIWTWSLKTQVNLKTKELQASNAEILALNEALEQRVEARTSEINAINQELRDFAYIVSHDLKAPLRGISQVAKWLSEDTTLNFNEENRELMDLLINRVHRMDNLISGILNYSKASRTTGFDNRIDLNAMLTRIIGSMAIPNGVQITVQPNMPEIMGNEVRMEEVFQNLIHNAVQHVNLESGTVAVGYSDEDDHWMFWVRDNGLGIDSKYFEKIFGMFQTLEAKDNKESTGIGLTIVKKIIELHGGKIWVESIVGEGATFLFTLPKGGNVHALE